MRSRSGVGNRLQAGDIDTIKRVLGSNGFELLEDSKARLIEGIKTAIIKFVHHNHDKEPMRLKYSEYIARELGRDYHALSALFSAVENLTIERYIIKQRIERVKELMRYGDQTLSEIAYMMNYSSVQHLSNQFKKVTGLNPTQFKRMVENTRKPLDKVSPATK